MKNSDFGKFKRQLDESFSLIDSKLDIEFRKEGKQTPSHPSNFHQGTQSLLERCKAVTDKSNQKPVIRIIHHLACTGGSLFSKCISAMPNVYLLSEVHPYSKLLIGELHPNYAPTDIISLTKHANVPDQMDLAAKIFRASIDETYRHVSNLGGVLVLRDHTHSDYNTGNSIFDKGTVARLLKDKYEVKRILTVRNPLDSYSSLVRNGWVHFEPKSFDEYCRRLLLLLNNFENKEIFKYEEFIKYPSLVMKSISKALDLSYDEGFEQIFDIFKVTGDSGRSTNYIGEKPRLVSEELIKESKSSKYYEKYLELYDVSKDANEDT